MSLEDACAMYAEKEPRGEYVIVIEGTGFETLALREQEKWTDVPIPDHVNMYMDQGLDKKEAMKRAAKDRGTSKGEVYKALLQ